MITNWDQVEIVVSIEKVMEIAHLGSYDAVRRAIRARKIPPPRTTCPMQWSKADLMRHYGESVSARRLSA